MATSEADFRTRLQDWLPKIVLAPSFAVTLLFVYGFILFTVVLNNLVQSSTGVNEYNVLFAGAILAALPTFLVYIVAGRYFVRGLMAGSVKG